MARSILAHLYPSQRCKRIKSYGVIKTNMASSSTANQQEDEIDAVRIFIDSIDFKGIIASPQTWTINPLPPDLCLTNRHMLRLHEALKSLPKDDFFKFIKALLTNNESINAVLELQTPKQFSQKIDRFLTVARKERKTSSSYLIFEQKLYNFEIADNSKQKEGKRKRFEQQVAEGEEEEWREEKKRCYDQLTAITELYEAEKVRVKEAEMKVREENLKLEAERRNVRELEKRLKDAERELSELKAEKEERKEEIHRLTGEKESLKQSKKGIQSGIARAKTARESLPPQPPPSDVSSSSRGVNTEISGIKHDIVMFRSQSEGDRTDCQTGQRYYGYGAHKMISSGTKYSYFEVPSSTKSASTVSVSEIRRRAKFIDDVALSLSSGSAPVLSAQEEKKHLYVEVIKQNRPLFIDCLSSAGLSVMDTLTPEQTISMQSLLHLTNTQVKNMRVVLNKFNLNFLSSDRQTRKKKKKMIEHVDGEKVETGFIGLHKTKNDKNVTPCAYLRVKCLVTFIKDLIEKDTFEENKHPGFRDRWWLMFAGDKGGDHMKFHVQIINAVNSGSPDNLHVYCMFEANDTVENMRKVWLYYHEQVLKMQEEGFKVCGKYVFVFLGGDYHYLDDNLGHQGSSATYPSSMDYVLLADIQNHGGKPHTPDDCKHVVRRTVEEMKQDYVGNLADTRNMNDLHLNGKEHNSICGPFIFPVKSIDQVVPASLHINLGVTMVGYNLLNDECKAIDGVSQRQDRGNTEEEWEVASLAHLAAVEQEREHAKDIIRMTNILDRQEAILAGNLKKNDEIASMSVVSAGRRKKSRGRNVTLEKCSSLTCIISSHDENVQWVECDDCENWVHTLCEALTPVEQLAITDESPYKCRKCSGVESIINILEEKIEHLYSEKEKINMNIVNLKTECDNLKAKCQRVMGPKEKELSDALESIHVVRQAYHGNVMVGNHCITVLNNYKVLTAVVGEVQDMFNWFFSSLSDIMKLVMARRFLTDDERTRLRTLCHSFGAKFPIVFPDRNVTRKIHELVFNVPDFADKWHTVGLLSEQEGESMHAIVNAELRTLACVRNRAEKLRMVLERDEIRSVADKNMITPTPRLCQMCKIKGTRSFLRCGNDSLRHCKLCEPSFFDI